ncbi:MAG: glycolate oxidase subunit GlcF [Betaproteobacteria bacterium]|nr:glycolate oxidase subunit GlcF [Betaproteobacteria bacterium]
MQTAIDHALLQRTEVGEADAILRGCVHCGFCNATCPTYQILGSELDGPRGRIYLVKEMLEGRRPSARTRLHLDRCLTCRACETTCPSGVQYGRLLGLGRQEIERRTRRPLWERALRAVLLAILPYPPRVRAVLWAARLARPVLPSRLRGRLPLRRVARPRPALRHRRRMLLLEGCVQPVVLPSTNAAAARVLDRLGISVASAARAGCCGALHEHLAHGDTARELMRRNIDAWWPYVEEGVEALVTTASACGLMVKDYGHALAGDAAYAAKAARISALARDLSEVLAGEALERFADVGKGRRIAWHAPCTLCHGQGITGSVEGILERCGYVLEPVADAHLCCGAAGTYSLLQPALSQELLARRVVALTAGTPDAIATGNIGCQLHLAGASPVPVCHWIELLHDPQENDVS